MVGRRRNIKVKGEERKEKGEREKKRRLRDLKKRKREREKEQNKKEIKNKEIKAKIKNSFPFFLSNKLMFSVFFCFFACVYLFITFWNHVKINTQASVVVGQHQKMNRSEHQGISGICYGQSWIERVRFGVFV